MEHLIANLGKLVRRETLLGRTYLVAPLTLLVPGVLAGSKGPLFYPPEEVSKHPGQWNHIPITLGHPTVNGLPASAREPGTLEQFGLGFVFGARYDDRLRGEAWFDLERTQVKAPRIIANLEQGLPLEVSTGLFTTNEPAPEGSTHNSQIYQAVARAYRPDHLAILLDSTGACSVRDGCGVLNEEPSDRRTFWMRLGEFLGIAPNPTTNQPSHDDLREQLNKLVRERFAGNPPGEARLAMPAGMGSGTLGMTRPSMPLYIEEVYDKYLVYRSGEKCYRLDYTTDLRSGKVVLDAGPPQEVIKQTTYKPVTNEEDPTMNKTQLVDWLVANCDCWQGQGDREVLNGLPEVKLAGLKSLAEKARTPPPAPTPAPVPPPPVALPAAPLTEAEWLASAPAGIRSAVQNAMVVEQGARSALVDRLTANVAQDQLGPVRERLMQKTIDELQMLVGLLPASPAPAWPGLAPNYGGAAAPPTGNQGEEDLDVLQIPIFNYGEPPAPVPVPVPQQA